MMNAQEYFNKQAVGTSGRIEGALLGENKEAERIIMKYQMVEANLKGHELRKVGSRCSHDKAVAHGKGGTREVRSDRIHEESVEAKGGDNQRPMASSKRPQLIHHQDEGPVAEGLP